METKRFPKAFNKELLKEQTFPRPGETTEEAVVRIGDAVKKQNNRYGLQQRGSSFNFLTRLYILRGL